MQVKGSVRQHAYLMIPQRLSGSARCGAPTGWLWPSTPRPLVGARTMRDHRIDRDRGFEPPRTPAGVWSNADSRVAKPSQAVQYRRD